MSGDDSIIRRKALVDASFAIFMTAFTDYWRDVWRHEHESKPLALRHDKK